MNIRPSQRTSVESKSQFHNFLDIKRIEIEDTLENVLNLTEIITEKIYNQFKGNFFRILSSQNGSRILQKCLSKTPVEILSKIFNEVYL